MNTKRIVAFVLASVLAAGVCIPVLAADTDSAGNIFEADDSVTLSDIPFFGAMVAGQTVNVNASEAEGSVMAAGQEVGISSTSVGESLYVAGNSVTVSDSDVTGNIYAAGNSVVIGGGTEGNGVYAAGNVITFAGSAKAVCLGGSTVTLSGEVDGDAVLEGDKVIVTEDAVVSGKLKVISSNEPEISEDAVIETYSFEEVSEDAEDAGEIAAKVGVGTAILNKIKSCIYWVIAMAAFGLILCWLFNDHLSRAADMLKMKPGVMIGSGIISWMCIPVAALILCCTCILAPIGGMLMLAYVLLLCAGLGFAGASLVRLFLPDMNVYLSAMIGIAVLEVVRMVPVIGSVVGIVADMYLLAYVVQYIWTGIRNRKTAPSAGDFSGEQ